MMTASSRLTASPVMASALMLSRNRITAKRYNGQGYYGQQQGYYVQPGYPPQPPPVYRQW